ncbi:accessory Sec system protein Asp3, partial [Staphylococcus epidermidis]|uniref:accessory Sec system protein Asp3 n=1 Tax=Staphylococcus epidermidis TaxID=1282 RepID=UPI0037DA2B64
MYPTNLPFNQHNIYFHNPFIPSPTIIHTCYILTHFPQHPLTPNLPILKEPHQYQ